MYRRKRLEFRRGNQYVKFHVTLRKQFLVLVNVMKDHSAAEYNKTIPVVTMDSEFENERFIVVSLNGIQNQVGLVGSIDHSMEYKAVIPYVVFNQNMKRSAGKL
ncbi:MAG: hypothetical protein EXX96DRAFT_534202 [Benjaminiella poitrasii]|nr:MAG: hypothetical protein EXX96DRAFT_534202 [Benjaminiella poitrasii]